MNDNCLDMINPASSFQYYYLGNLWKDIGIVRENNIKVINLFTEPVQTSAIIERFFKGKIVGENRGAELHYNLKTMYSSLWGNESGYVCTQAEVMEQLAHFIRRYK